MMTARAVLAVLAVLAALVAIVAIGCGSSDQAVDAERPPTSVDGLNGGVVELTAADTVTVVAFIASWCAPCRKELPELQARHDQAVPGIRFVGVAVTEEPAATRRLLAETGVTFEVGSDPDGVALADYEFIGLPGTLLLDGDGSVMHRYAGTIDFVDLDRRLDDASR